MIKSLLLSLLFVTSNAIPLVFHKDNYGSNHYMDATLITNTKGFDLDFYSPTSSSSIFTATNNNYIDFLSYSGGNFALVFSPPNPTNFLTKIATFSGFIRILSDIEYNSVSYQNYSFFAQLNTLYLENYIFYLPFYGAYSVTNFVIEFYFDTSSSAETFNNNGGFDTLGLQFVYIRNPLVPTTGYNDGYNYGYNIGYDDGVSDGYNDGYDDGASDGFNSGYNSGFNDGYLDGESSANIMTDTIFGVVGAVVGFISTLSGFEFLGISLVDVMLFFVTIGVVLLILKVIK